MVVVFVIIVLFNIKFILFKINFLVFINLFKEKFLVNYS